MGIARDCALRGIECLLVEKDDFSAGTSGASSGMIHGGPRYLMGDVNVTRLSCLDSGYIQKIARHLLFRIPFLYSVYQEKNETLFKAKIRLEGVESFFEAYDRFIPLKNGRPHTRLSPREVLELESGMPADNLVGGVTFDEWGIDVPRLCVANALDAAHHGATVLNHVKVVEVLREEDQIRGVRLKNLLTGQKSDVFCKYLVNATGPWSPRFGKMMGVNIKLRGGKGIHITFDRRLFNIAIVSQCIDGREIFIMPYENVSVLGTTDDDYFGDLDDQRCTQDEIEYLLDGMEKVCPLIRKARMVCTYSGVRPTIYRRNVYEDDLSREHQILDHEKQDGLKGAFSLIGGKLASYRIMSREVADILAKKLKVKKPSLTHVLPLPGGDEIPDVRELAQEYRLDPYLVSRLVYRHGSLSRRILDQIKGDPAQSALVCSCEPVTEAELRYVVKNELAQTLSDVRRRTRLTQGPCQGTNCLIASSSILASLSHKEVRGRDEMVRDFMKEWWWNRACVMNADQLKQEELNQAIHFCNNALDLI